MSMIVRGLTRLTIDRCAEPPLEQLRFVCPSQKLRLVDQAVGPRRLRSEQFPLPHR